MCFLLSLRFRNSGMSHSVWGLVSSPLLWLPHLLITSMAIYSIVRPFLIFSDPVTLHSFWHILIHITCLLKMTLLPIIITDAQLVCTWTQLEIITTTTASEFIVRGVGCKSGCFKVVPDILICRSLETTDLYNFLARARFWLFSL